MSVMEFVLVAHAIIVGLAVAEILRGFSELIRSEQVQVNYRLLLIAGWTLLLLLQAWWAIWRVGDRAVWTFPEFIIFFLPVGILYVIALLLQPYIFGGIIPLVFASQIAIAALALVASRVNSPPYSGCDWRHAGSGTLARPVERNQ